MAGMEAAQGETRTVQRRFSKDERRHARRERAYLKGRLVVARRRYIEKRRAREFWATTWHRVKGDTRYRFDEDTYAASGTKRGADLRAARAAYEGERERLVRASARGATEAMRERLRIEAKTIADRRMNVARHFIRRIVRGSGELATKFYNLNGATRFVSRSAIIAAVGAGAYFAIPAAVVGAATAASGGAFYAALAGASLAAGAAVRLGGHLFYLGRLHTRNFAQMTEEAFKKEAEKLGAIKKWSGDLAWLVSIATGATLRTVGHGFLESSAHLSSPDETLAHAAPRMRAFAGREYRATEDLVADQIARKGGAPRFLPVSGRMRADLVQFFREAAIDSSAPAGHLVPVPSEIASADPAAASTAADAYTRLVSYFSSHDRLLNTPENSALIEEGVARTDRMRALLYASAKAEALQEGPVKAFALREAARLSDEHAGLEGWLARFDAAHAGATREIAHERAKGLPLLLAEYVATPADPAAALRKSRFFETFGALFHPRQEHALAIASGALSEKNFELSKTALRTHLALLDSLIARYERVISPASPELVKLHAVRADYADMNAKLEALDPAFEHLSEIRGSLDGGAGTFGGKTLTDALIVDRLKPAGLERFADDLQTLHIALRKAEAVKPGMVWDHGKAIPIERAMRFKEGAGSELFPELGASFHRFQEQLRNLGYEGIRVNEGWPLTRAHKSALQEEGMSLDFSFSPSRFGGSPVQRADEIAAAIYAGEANATPVVFETDSPARAASVTAGAVSALVSRFGMSRQAALALAQNHIRYIPGHWISGEHFSYYDTGGRSPSLEMVAKIARDSLRR